MLDHVLRQTCGHPAIESITVVCNGAHFDQFHTWAQRAQDLLSLPLRLINDRSTSPENKLGAIGDLAFAIEHGNLHGRDLAVVAGDTLFSQSQHRFIDQSLGKPCTTAIYNTGNLETVKRIASVTVDDSGLLKSFIEKPANPTSSLGGIALYYFRADTLPYIFDYLAEGNNPDQAGHLIAWLMRRVPTFGFAIKGSWIDVGTPETYAEALQHHALQT